MASDDSMNMLSSSLQEDDGFDHDDAITDDGQPHPSNLSRLSMCTSSVYTNEDDDLDDCDGMRMFMSRLSLESFDADEEISDDEEEEGKEGKGGGSMGMLDLSSDDSDKEPGCYSLPATPPRRRIRGGGVLSGQMVGVKEYASENEAQKGLMRQKMRRNLGRRRRVMRERLWLDGDDNNKSGKRKDLGSHYGYCNSMSGESEGGGSVVVITRPKGGRRSLCMDLEEVKACRDLGFELEHERMLEMPSTRVSLSGSTLDTSSGGNSPIANWRISSPGDDPRDVKARLKVWAQAVALASASRHGAGGVGF